MEGLHTKMNDPATKEDIEAAKAVLVEQLGKLDKSLKGMREQNSLEHGSLFTKMTHVGNLMGWLRDAWHRFSILPTPPEERTKRGVPPKDDTQ